MDSDICRLKELEFSSSGLSGRSQWRAFTGQPGDIKI